MGMTIDDFYWSKKYEKLLSDYKTRLKAEKVTLIDKIRAEIEQLSTSTCTETRRVYIDADDFKENVLAILDKHKAESDNT